MNTYIAIWNGKRAELRDTTLYAAKLQAISLWRVPKSKQGLLVIALVALADDSEVVHSTASV